MYMAINKETIECMSADDVVAYMETLRDEEQRCQLIRFFKTGKGQYGEGDEFLGLKVPQTREVVKHAADLPLGEIATLLTNRYHEIRLCGLLMMVKNFEKWTTKRWCDDKEAIKKRDEIVRMYITYGDYANNWDLVDLSAPKILGRWLTLPTLLGNKTDIIDELALSGNLWRERMSMVCTWTTSRYGDPSWCLRYAEMHLHHPHDLMHKAVGWMLREMGKHVSMDLLRGFLEQHASEMPRTTLRYAIEKMTENERFYWMKKE